MRILLIQSKMNKRPMDTDLKTRMSPSLALLTLASLTHGLHGRTASATFGVCCQSVRHEVEIVNENVDKINFDSQVDLVGITITLDVMPRATQIAKKFREKGIPVIAGGIHVTCSPNECLPYFDAICIGAAERVWAHIIDDVANKKLQQVYHDMDNFGGEEIVPPHYTALKKGKYLCTNVITTSRGCPNKCGFCYNSCENGSYVRRPVKDVLKDIEALGTKHILFIDDNFIGSPGYTKELLESFRGMDLKWSAAVTTKIGDYPELLDLMAETGCQSLFIGLESINNDSLRDVNKDNQFEKYERLVREIHSRGIMINASMVFGLDGDKPDVFQRTLDWLVKNKIETLTSHILTPYPGTQLYKRMESEKRIVDYDLSKYNTAHVVFKPKGMTAEELYDGYIGMYKDFYSFGNILRRMPENKAQRLPYILFNIFYRKFGKATSIVSRIIPLNLVGRLAAFLSYRLKRGDILVYLLAIVSALLVYCLSGQNIEIALKPHVLAMNVLYQSRFEYIPHLGYREVQGLYMIGRECLGGKLFVCLFSILVVCHSNNTGSLANKCLNLLGLCAVSIFLAYFITIVRIAASVPFCEIPGFKLIHTILSLIIYFGSGIALYEYLSHKNKTPIVKSLSTVYTNTRK